jgi:hypothetical protein
MRAKNSDRAHIAAAAEQQPQRESLATRKSGLNENNLRHSIERRAAHSSIIFCTALEKWLLVFFEIADNRVDHFLWNNCFSAALNIF